MFYIFMSQNKLRHLYAFIDVLRTLHIVLSL